MVRREGDSWGIADGVGRTALGAATARAWESSAELPLFIDPYAQLFLDAAGGLGSELAPERKTSITNYAAARTKWFDEFFIAAGSAGITQVVILAAGLDARAWRLPWLSDTVIYEVDQPKVLAFKADTLASSGAQPAVKYVPVAVDLRGDWPYALTAAGFDHTEPTTWSLEGLLPYLPAASQDRLFEQITLYSARGSRVAVEAFSPAFFEPANLTVGEQSPETEDLWFMGVIEQVEERTDVAAWLCAHRWEVDSISAVDVMNRYHRAWVTADEDPLSLSVFVEGRLL
ncbi:MAG TPA: SAM-dependent methyltransferase [Mycobacterium sp.]|nr:SAM-dependent methyltransferase [Mycobacterium sp.]